MTYLTKMLLFGILLMRVLKVSAEFRYNYTGKLVGDAGFIMIYQLVMLVEGKTVNYEQTPAVTSSNSCF